MKKVVLGLSGGVDSSVAALLLKEQGFEVHAVFMKNFSDTKNKFTGECNWREEWRMAQKAAFVLGIPIKLIDYEKQYKKDVIAPMFKDYAKGLTPNPDILCNKLIKFPALFAEAKKLKAKFVATGHYARIKHDEPPTRKNKTFCALINSSSEAARVSWEGGRGAQSDKQKNKISCQLLQGKDKSKDQSYFLFQLTEKELQKILFPIGDLTKEEVRKIAEENNLPNWNKKGTSGICFVGKIDMKDFLKNKIKEKPGKVFSPDGKLIGKHPGSSFFTIGERIGESKGISLDSAWKKENPEKIYVAEKKDNNLIVAPEDHPILKKKKVFLKSLHLINPKEKVNRKKFKARIRHLGELHSGILTKENNRWAFYFKKGVKGIAEGQSLVLYDKKRIIGGGEMQF
jgi:tRNA-uridine 2-sulfurtransferase